jgi:hypothetical protein
VSSTRVQDHLIDGLRAATLTPQPWPHSYLPATLPQDLALELSRSFGGFAMELCEETEREKSYRFRTVLLDGFAADQLPTSGWAEMARLLADPAYRVAMSELTGVDLHDRHPTLSLWEYQTGDWLAPHVDKPEKLVTQIFYLTEGWGENDGGRLLILRSADRAAVARALPPVLGASAVLVRGADSWHAVEPPGSRTVPRRSLTATFWR